MKRPEYVAVVTAVYAAAIRENREPTAQEMERLQQAFSRSGFTQGYFLDQKGPQMFGTRTETEAPEELYAQARESYRREVPLVPVDLTAAFQAGRPCALTARDDAGHTAQVQGDLPEAARTRETTAQEVQDQLAKTGGTPYFVRDLRLELEPGLSLPKALLNHLRRETLDQLSRLRSAPPARRTLDLPPLPQAPEAPAAAGLIFSLATPDQLTPELCALPHRFIDLPVGAFLRDAAKVQAALAQGVKFRAVLPRICWDGQQPELDRQLDAAARLGVQAALVPTWDRADAARDHGLALYGDFGLGVYNSRTLETMAHLGFAGATASFELKTPMLRDLAKLLPTEAIVYGRLPLMMLEQYPGGACPDPEKPTALTDRLGVTFPLRPAPGGRWELMNSQVLYLADKPEWQRLGLDAGRLLFTDETPQQCVRIAREYQNGGQPPKNFTRGLYYRDVE